MERKHILFFIYTIIYTLYGATESAVGPLIVYISRNTLKDQTFYSFIFLARGIGYLAGGQTIKILAKRYKYHSLFLILSLIGGLVLIVSTLNFGFLNLFWSMFTAAACSCMLNTLCNMGILAIF